MWKDITNYSRDDNKRIPTVLEIKYNSLRIVIVWNHREIGKQWCMHCYGLDINKLQLNLFEYSEIEKAKINAIRIVAKICLINLNNAINIMRIHNKEKTK